MRTLACWCALVLPCVGLPSPVAEALPSDANAPPTPRIFLGYAGAYPQSPPSAFGHVFLVLGEQDKPPLLWEGVNFGLDSRGRSGWWTLSTALTGNGASVVSRSPLFEILDRYRAMESRTIYLLELDLDPNERDRILQEVTTRETRTARYGFLAYNCATEIQDILSHSIGDIPEGRGRLVSPIGLVRTVVLAHRVRSVSRQASLAETVRRDERKLSARDRILLDSLFETGSDSSLWDRLGDDAITSLSSRWLLSDATGKRPFEIPTAPLSRQILLHALPPPVGFAPTGIRAPHGSPRLGVAQTFRSNGRASIQVELRPTLHDLNEAPAYFEDAGTLELLASKVRILPDPSLESFVLVEQGNRPRSVGFRPAPSWSFSAGSWPSIRPGLSRETGLRAGAGPAWSDADLPLETRIRLGVGVYAEGGGWRRVDAEPSIETLVRLPRGRLGTSHALAIDSRSYAWRHSATGTLDLGTSGFAKLESAIEREGWSVQVGGAVYLEDPIPAGP